MVSFKFGQEQPVIPRTDVSAAAVVAEELQAAGYRGLRGVTSHMTDGVLVLQGCVSNFYQKQIAQTIARRHLSSSVVIDNRIRVEAPADRN